MNTVWLAFITGLTTGGISCLAVQGGLLASSVAQKNDQTGSAGDGLPEPTRNWQLVAMFLAAKLLAYTLLGLALGALGSMLALSPRTLGLFQIAVGVFMLATVGRILNIHPIFRYFVIQPPRVVYRLLKNNSRSQSLFAPAMLGLLTVLMPCGVTQTMMVAALGTGNPWAGAAILFAFVLGTSPVFFALGLAAAEFLQRRVFAYIAAGAIAVLAVLSINGGLALTGSVYTLNNFYRALTTNIDALDSSGQVAGVDTAGKQEVTITVASRGYTASATTLKKDIPVRLTLVTNGTQGCSRAFNIPEYNISKVLPPTGTEVLEFTPTKTGRLAYTCSMGMYTGEFTVVL